MLEVFYREGDDEVDNYDPYATELKQNKQQEEDAGKEKGWQTSELYSAKEKSSSLNVSIASYIHNSLNYIFVFYFP